MNGKPQQIDQSLLSQCNWSATFFGIFAFSIFSRYQSEKLPWLLSIQRIVKHWNGAESALQIKGPQPRAKCGTCIFVFVYWYKINLLCFPTRLKFFQFVFWIDWYGIRCIVNCDTILIQEDPNLWIYFTFFSFETDWDLLTIAQNLMVVVVMTTCCVVRSASLS